MSRWLPVKAIYLAAFEVAIDLAICINEEILLKNLFNQMGTSAPIELTLFIGLIHSVLCSFSAATNWTIILLIFQVIYGIFSVLARNWTKYTFCAWLLTSGVSTIGPARYAYLAEQIPPNVDVKSKFYWGVIVWAQFLAKVVYWIFTAHSDNKVIVRDAQIVFVSLISAYTVVIIALELFHYDGPIIPKLCPVNITDYDSVVTVRELMLIGLAAGSHYFAVLIMDKTRISRLKSALLRQTNTPVIPVHTLLFFHCIPYVSALLLIPIVRFVKLTDLKLVGIAMIGTCASLIFVGIAQGAIDEVSKAPQKREAIIQITNMLSSPSHLNSVKFGLGSTKWVRIEPYASAEFLVEGLLKTDNIPISVMNVDYGSWDETLMIIEEGKSSSYVITEGKFVKINDVHHGERNDAILSESKLIFLCLVENCDWTIEFAGSNYSQKIQLRDETHPVSKGFCEDTYKIRGITPPGSNYLFNEIARIETPKIYTVVVTKKDEVPLLKIFESKKINKLDFHWSLIPEILIGASSGLFELGMLHFLFSQTDLHRYPTYAQFFFLSKGVPWFIFAVLRVNLINYVEGYVVRFAVFYNIGSLLCFLILSYKY